MPSGSGRSGRIFDGHVLMGAPQGDDPGIRKVEARLLLLCLGAFQIGLCDVDLTRARL
jgi:hypothetical protein